jgi:hypothetical protein
MTTLESKQSVLGTNEMMNESAIRKHILEGKFFVEPRTYQISSLDESMMQYIIGKNDDKKAYRLNQIALKLLEEKIGHNPNRHIELADYQKVVQKISNERLLVAQKKYDEIKEKLRDKSSRYHFAKTARKMSKQLNALVIIYYAIIFLSLAAGLFTLPASMYFFLLFAPVIVNIIGVVVTATAYLLSNFEYKITDQNIKNQVNELAMKAAKNLPEEMTAKNKKNSKDNHETALKETQQITDEARFSDNNSEFKPASASTSASAPLLSALLQDLGTFQTESSQLIANVTNLFSAPLFAAAREKGEIIYMTQFIQLLHKTFSADSSNIRLKEFLQDTSNLTSLVQSANKPFSSEPGEYRYTCQEIVDLIVSLQDLPHGNYQGEPTAAMNNLQTLQGIIHDERQAANSDPINHTASATASL